MAKNISQKLKKIHFLNKNIGYPSRFLVDFANLYTNLFVFTFIALGGFEISCKTFVEILVDNVPFRRCIVPDYNFCPFIF